ncbi:class I SAM-dependent methyltransferase [Leifsonia sp. NPDC058230]|uniref:class I SAM-dependent methyltransferase n=1 Tax=Leifsonia sp. NPDC058230 TaxID=3346391 RepID=UPI0036DC1AC2
MNSAGVPDRWERGDAYERYIGRWSRLVAAPFLDWLGEGADRRWVDVGCGTGALSEAVLARFAPSSVIAVEPSDGFRAVAAAAVGSRATVLAGMADALPLPDESADVLVSGLVLNFVPDIPAALAEQRRVAHAGATIGAYVWDYAEGMQLIKTFWEAVADLEPGDTALDEGARFPICSPGALVTAFGDAGLADADVTAIEVPTVFESFEDYWQPFLGGQGPGPAYAMSLVEADRMRLRELLRSRLPVAADGTIALTARAWAVRASVTA